MNNIPALTLTLVLLGATCASGQGVTLQPGGFSNQVRETAWVRERPLEGSPPPQDANKWYVLAVVDNSTESTRLLNDFASNIKLTALREWGSFGVCDVTTTIGQSRASSLGISGGRLPRVEVFPPPWQTQYPYCVVFGRQGYDGNADQLASDMYAKIRSFQKPYGEMVRSDCQPYVYGSNVGFPYKVTGTYGRPCTPYEPTPTPVPVPTPEPQPLPILPPLEPQPLPVDPQPTPDLPLLPPTVDPFGPSPEPGTFPNYPCITVVVDQFALGESDAANWLAQVARSATWNQQGWGSAKAQCLRLTDPRAKAFPVGPGDTPSIWFTDKGRILGSINRSAAQILFGALSTQAAQPAAQTSTPQGASSSQQTPLANPTSQQQPIIPPPIVPVPSVQAPQPQGASAAPSVMDQLDYSLLATKLLPYLPPIYIKKQWVGQTQPHETVPVRLGGGFTFLKYPLPAGIKASPQ